MKKFNELREQYLEEKLKASDPAGTYIHDFVHSDNPKFVGKSKAKRIQMALAASYAAKEKSRNEDVELDEASYINGVKQDPESKVWKLTSMSHADAVAKHGKENVRHSDAVNRSGDKTGKKHVEILTKLGEDVEQQDEGILGAIGKAVGGAVKTVASAGRSLASDVAKPIVQNIVPKSIQTTGSSNTTNTSTKPAKPVKLKTEETKQIDELSKSTLGSYVKKASQDAVINRKIGADFENRASKARKPDMKNASISLADRFKSKSRQRIRGVVKAVDRLSK